MNRIFIRPYSDTREGTNKKLLWLLKLSMFILIIILSIRTYYNWLVSPPAKYDICFSINGKTSRLCGRYTIDMYTFYIDKNTRNLTCLYKLDIKTGKKAGDILDKYEKHSHTITKDELKEIIDALDAHHIDYKKEVILTDMTIINPEKLYYLSKGEHLFVP